MSQRVDVLIVGGGVIGLTTAWFLARDGVRTAVVERGEFGREASWAGAGILPPGRFDRAESDYDQLRALSSEMFPALSEQLRDAVGIDNGYRRCGGIELADHVDPVHPSQWINEGIRFEVIETDQLVQFGLSRQFEAGYWFPDMAQVRNPWHLRALEAACRREGVHLQPRTSVQPIAAEDAQQVETSAGPIEFGKLLVAAGAWSDQLLKPLGWTSQIRPIRGQMVLYRTAVAGSKPIVISGREYVVPRDDGLVLVGSTEDDVGYDKSNTNDGVSGLQQFAVQTIPALSDAVVEMTWAGLRPASGDGWPLLGRVPSCRNVYIASGHFRSGIQLSPATALVMSQLLQDRPTAIPLASFAPDRPMSTRKSFAFSS